MDINMKWLKKEVKKLTSSPALTKSIKKIDKITSFRKSTGEKKQFKFEDRDHIYLVDPDMRII